MHGCLHLAGKPRFAAVAPEIWRFFEGADVLGYNALRFDVPLLAAEFARLPAGSISGATSSSKAGTKVEVLILSCTESGAVLMTECQTCATVACLSVTRYLCGTLHSRGHYLRDTRPSQVNNTSASALSNPG